MKRILLEKLLSWKNKSQRKPLLIDGARQTGKTYLLKELLGQHFKNVVRIDFLETPEVADAFVRISVIPNSDSGVIRSPVSRSFS